MRRRWSIALGAAGAGLCLGAAAQAQPRGAAQLAGLVDGLGVSARVLVIGAHPDDEDTQLITWLARGRQVETAYLSLTRGDGGQNLIGNELGEALGAIRTAELLAARRLDGGRQYFTRAFDFGFSRDAGETLRQWSRDSILRDVVTVVRAFRPQVIVSVFTGTPSDGHGHHQVAGLLAREAYDHSADTARFPRAATEGHPGWTVAKFYRAASFRNQERATLRINVGEFDPVAGQSYGELAAQSRSQHRSQAFGTLQPKGPRFDLLMREASRVNEGQDARTERGLFDGVDTTWARFRAAVPAGARRAALDSLAGAFAGARGALDLRRPASVLPALARVQRLLEALCGPAAADNPCLAPRADTGGTTARHLDLARTMELAVGRVQVALGAAAGVAVEATAAREVWAVGEPVPISVAVYNRGEVPVTLAGIASLVNGRGPAGASRPQVIAPDSVRRDSLRAAPEGVTQPWWLAAPRRGAMCGNAGPGIEETGRRGAVVAVVSLEVAGASFTLPAPVMHRFADAIRGEVNRPVVVAPAVGVTLDHAVEYVTVGAAIERSVRVHLRAHQDGDRVVEVGLVLPAGLAADTAVRRVRMARSGDERRVTFVLRGRLPAGRHVLSVVARSEGRAFDSGYEEVRHEHIPPQRLYRPARLVLQAVDVSIPAGMTVAYVKGVGDNSAAALEQLGVGVTVIDPAALAQADLSRYRAVVVGPRAYEASPELVAANHRLLDYARSGGTLVVQYGQYEMTTPGVMPWPITLGRPADRVTVEDGPVRLLDPRAALVAAPNRITAADFEGWDQDRSLYMPRTFDASYRPFLEVNDPGQPPNAGALLVAPLGRGTYVYTTLAFFRQLPNGVPGAARLFVNLLAAKAQGAVQ